MESLLSKIRGSPPKPVVAITDDTNVLSARLYNGKSPTNNFSPNTHMRLSYCLSNKDVLYKHSNTYESCFNMQNNNTPFSSVKRHHESPFMDIVFSTNGANSFNNNYFNNKNSFNNNNIFNSYNPLNDINSQQQFNIDRNPQEYYTSSKKNKTNF